MSLYLDTNIFIYSTDPKSPYFDLCRVFLGKVANEGLEVVTSVETLQEIVHYFKSLGKIDKALSVCKSVFGVVDLVLPLDLEVVDIYMGLVKKYGEIKKIDSRDFIHLAVCINEKIATIVTYDKGYTLVKEVMARKPEDLMGEIN
ncbi:hypothetical protein A2630_01080 [Candidatus Woesebacteria bacterium RIFCSPHIGHO2_01_FULL_44_10]|uniref:PIN domain-containing protein n=1 Tax=Candidatus Woesebacteria bacterium RIFCSPLOWO2_01_FULL_44_14 TaxID=1802525 RepID=A0A1F8C2U4_9BACT|nr:MAG: hypothetical protein A2630_01080 [Candidatus Woesebacteria bacterium RIFCSPHIGHO2_01_FULL_44_10]OGM54719.1 MAG: hypothetical protein A3F62_02855 [Candidatus Woesebacteria bacterium RIFCSPHIGHO2_12_FULL_44_11]OGM70189.1 MAG: hypothetical protein A2975_03895 [Candidatus Woesebacteria bacterium RIFCSPLOWO2_01_FULL_44_14]